MSTILTKGTGNQVKNKAKAFEIALRIYENSHRIDDNKSNISIDGNVYRVAAYADPTSKSALVDNVNAHISNEPPIWYRNDITGVLLVKQTADNRLLFFVIDKEPLFNYLQTYSADKISIDWTAVNKIKIKQMTKVYKA